MHKLLSAIDTVTLKFTFPPYHTCKHMYMYRYVSSKSFTVVLLWQKLNVQLDDVNMKTHLHSNRCLFALGELFQLHPVSNLSQGVYLQPPESKDNKLHLFEVWSLTYCIQGNICPRFIYATSTLVVSGRI